MESPARRPVDGLAPVIPLRPVAPERPRSCFICRHAVLSTSGTYCPMFMEMVLDEADAASDCDAYIDDPERS